MNLKVNFFCTTNLLFKFDNKLLILRLIIDQNVSSLFSKNNYTNLLRLLRLLKLYPKYTQPRDP